MASVKSKTSNGRRKTINRRNQYGFSLIEILVTLIILSIGFLGIMFLFPISFGTNKDTLEETQAALIAESFISSLDRAFKKATYDEETQRNIVKIIHDIKASGGEEGFYTLKLPSIEDKWVHHPGEIASPQESPEKLPAFELNADPSVQARIEEVTKEFDPVNIYSQFMISFAIRSVLPKGKNMEDYINASLDLYEFRIYIFRKTGKDKKSIVTTLTYAKSLQ